MSDAFFIIFIISLIAANVVVFVCIFAGGKRGREDFRSFLKASSDMITELDRFRKNIPEMSEEFVSDIRPVIDSYIKQRVEAYLIGSDTALQPACDVSKADTESVSDDIYPPARVDGPVQNQPLTSGLSYDDIEKVFELVFTEDTYRKTFLRKPENMFRSSTGKQVSIREEYHRTLMWLLNAGAGDCNTFTGFIDNLLAEHFNKYGETIRNIVKSSNNIPDAYERT